MIQRIQTIYLAIAIVLISIVSFGMEFLSFVDETNRFSLNSYGVSIYKLDDNSLVETLKYPFYLSLFSLILLVFITIMSYKNLKRQLKLARTTLFIYLILIIVLLIISTLGSSLIVEGDVKRELGLAYLLFIAGLPFVFMANLNIKRDKNLIDSLNRLR